MDGDTDTNSADELSLWYKLLYKSNIAAQLYSEDDVVDDDDELRFFSSC